MVNERMPENTIYHVGYRKKHRNIAPISQIQLEL